MPASSGWVRVAKGLQLVATDGASRITSAVVSSNIATKHLPELTATIIKAGGNHASAAQSLYVNAIKKKHTDLGGREASVNGTIYDQKSSVTLNGEVGSGIGMHDIKQNDCSEQITLEPLKKSLIANDTSDPNREIDISSLSIQNNNHGDEHQHDSTKTTKGEQQPISEQPHTAHVVQSQETSIDNLHTQRAELYDDEHQTQHLPEGSAVPTTRISRAFGFASLGAGLALGTISELARRTLGQSNNDSADPLVLSNDANAQRLSDSLRRMRGAAMKLGQMLSIQDESIAPPALTNALTQVRKSAEAMPQHQLMLQLEDQWGNDWREKIELEDQPFAAASIGQVHRGTLLSPTSDGITRVAVKVQYPGVADSIESDLSNLTMLVKATGLSPPGLFLENVIRVGRDELKVECDYRREVANQQRFRSLISSDLGLVTDRFVVPQVIDALSTDRILVTELVRGGTIDKVVNLDQDERNRIGRAIMRLTMLELFVWRFMQTDPNWGNFLYDVRTRTTYLIDFGAAREYDEEFVKGYLNIVIANANRDEKALINESIRMGFLTGEENDVMMEAHKLSGFCLGEPFQSYEPYDFKSSKVTSRISEHGAVFLKHRLTPPPEEVYTLHRKLAGAYNLCIKLGANISCRDLLDEIIQYYDNSKTN